jgi:hypothetical protein
MIEPLAEIKPGDDSLLSARVSEKWRVAINALIGLTIAPDGVGSVKLEPGKSVIDLTPLIDRIAAITAGVTYNEGENITFTEEEDGSITISSTAGDGTLPALPGEGGPYMLRVSGSVGTWVLVTIADDEIATCDGVVGVSKVSVAG